MRKVILASAAIALLGVGSMAQAGTTTIIATPAGSAVTNTIGSYDAAPGFGSGSWQANATTPGAKTDYYVSPQALFGHDITVGELESISYWTKKGTTHIDNISDWFFAFYTKKDGIGPAEGTWYGNRINTEPYFADNIVETAGAWNKWDSSATSNKLRFFDSTTNYFGSYADGFLSGLTGNANYMNQDILSFSVQTGSAWANGFDGLVDGLTIVTKSGDIGIVNFEANPVPEPAFFQMGALLGMSGVGLLKLRRKA